jgi:protein-glutamine gamma-glutamyltransferase
MARERRGAGGIAPTVSVDRYFDLSVLGLVTSGYLAVLGSGYLDVPTAAVTALGLFLRALMTTGILQLHISSRLTMAATIAYIGFYPLDYLFLSQDFVSATVHLVFFLAVVKVLTAHATRDYVFLGIVGFLELLAASILSANLTFFVFLALFLSFGVATFASSEIRRSIRKPHQLARGGLRRFQWRLAALTISMSFGILVLTGGLFFLLPRTAQAAFRHMVPERFHLPGFSNEMMLGEIGEIQKRQTPVMHVRIADDRRKPGLKWRGLALGRFDGRRWYNLPERGTPLPVGRDGMLLLADLNQRWRKGERISYEVQLSAMSSDALFLAGTPELIRINSRYLLRTSSDSLHVGFPNSEGMRYGAYSYLEETAAEGAYPSNVLSDEARRGYLQLPDIDGRIPELARRLTVGKGSDGVRAQAIQDYLQQGFRYTTTLLDHEVPDPLANFLFDRRAGHCEYFASAMAVMLRTLGIPTRVATGFQSGIYNPLSGWYVIRASDAHSWVEAYLPGRGWTTFDPTPPAEDVPANSLFARMGFYLDAADTFWQEWVLNYNLDRQLILASNMEDSGRSFSARWFDRLRVTELRWRRQALSFARQFGAAVVFLGLLAGAGWWAGPRVWTWWRTQARVRQVKRGQARASDATLLYERMLRTLHRRGFERPSWITPTEFARVLPASETAVLVERFTSEYNDLRFGGNPEAATRMVALLERIEQGRGR